MVVGIASTIGSRMGGVLSDKYGVARVIETALFVQGIALVLATVFSQSVYLVILFLFIWAVSAWTCGPIFNLNINTRFTKGYCYLIKY